MLLLVPFSFLKRLKLMSEKKEREYLKAAEDMGAFLVANQKERRDMHVFLSYIVVVCLCRERSVCFPGCGKN
jgi:hypothetical protein